MLVIVTIFPVTPLIYFSEEGTLTMCHPNPSPENSDETRRSKRINVALPSSSLVAMFDGKLGVLELINDSVGRPTVKDVRTYAN